MDIDHAFIESFYSGMEEDAEAGAFDGLQDEIDYPRRLNLEKIDNIEFDQVEMDDAPRFTDAYILSADMDGIPMNDEELDELNKNQGFVYQKLIDFLY
jgi:hypothetical protein